MATQKKRRRSTKSEKKPFNMQSPLQTYKNLEKEIEKTWAQLRKDVKKKDRAAIEKGRDDLLLLLGECHYMAQEWSRCMRNESL